MLSATSNLSEPDRTARRPGRREIALVVAAFGAAAILLTLPVAIHPTRTLPSDLLDTLLNSWILGWDADRLPHLLRGVWDAPIYFPYRDTLAFSENLFGVAVLVAPVYWATGNAVMTYNVAFLLSFALAGIGMYLLARSMTGSPRAAAIAAVAYAFSPFRFSQIAHLQMVATGWLPVTLWGLHEYFVTRERRWLGVFAGAYVFQALSNSYAAYHTAAPVAIVIAAELWSAKAARLRMAGELAVASLAVVAALAPVGASYYRVKHEYGLVRSAGEIADGGADLRAYTVSRDFIGLGRWLPTAVRSDPEKELFPGFFVVLLAAFALVDSRRRSERRPAVWTYAAIAGAGVVLSLGPTARIWGWTVTRHAPYDWLLHIVPGMDGMRVPARFAIVFVAGLSVLAGLGTLALLRHLPPRRRGAATLGLVVALVADGWTVPVATLRYPGRGRPEDRGIAEWLRGRPDGAVLHLPILTFNFEELNYQYVTLIHHHPLVNGFSGYNTPLQILLRNPRSPLYDYGRYRAVVRMLRALGVRYVVVHRNDYNLTQNFAHEAEHTLQGIRASDQVVAETRVLDAIAFELAPWTPEPEPATIAIAPTEFATSVSEDQDRRVNLTDGDPDSRWIGRQAGGSWIAARFERPHDVAAVTLQLAARSIDDYPREIQIDSSDAQGRVRTLYRDTPYPEFILAFLTAPEYPALMIRLPPNQTMVLTVREAAVESDRWWSVHELRLSQRAGVATR